MASQFGDKIGFELGGLSVKSLDRAVRARERTTPHGIDRMETATDRALGIGRAEAKDRVGGLNFFEPHLAPRRGNKTLSQDSFFLLPQAACRVLIEMSKDFLSSALAPWIGFDSRSSPTTCSIGSSHHISKSRAASATRRSSW